MKSNLFGSLFFSLLACSALVSQPYPANKGVINSYDQKLIKNQLKEFKKETLKNRQKAYLYASKHGLDTIIHNLDGTSVYLESIDELNNLFYVTTFNDSAAITSNVNSLHEAGELSLSLNGSGIYTGVWDDGCARLTHQDLIGRVFYMDGASNEPKRHATHVTGTLIGSGVGNQSAKGMAYGGSVQAWDFFDDISEIQSAAGDGMIVSNHSYGTSPSQLETWHFGAYLNVARSLDLITNSAPYYLPVFAVGNSRNNSPSHNSSKNGYDLITGRQVAKNILTVANCLAVNNYEGPESVKLWSTSSWGPTDDLRIKPEITAKGRQTLSTFHSSDNAYGVLTGTSMASPVVTGSIMLLQDLHYNLHNKYMMSHEVRALITGTALPSGEFGVAPDVKFGFGLLDAHAAAKVLLNSDFTCFFENITLENGQTYVNTFSSLDQQIPIEVTIAWNDPAGYSQENGIIDQEEARLINDLDLRIFDEQGNQFFPFYIQSFSQNYSTAVGDNSKDNIEKIHIALPIGDYTVQVSHKGNLVGGNQDFSIVVTGIAQSPFNILSINNNLQVCPGDGAEFEFNFQTIPSFNDEVNFTLNGLPEEIQVEFSVDSSSSDETVTFELTNLSAVEAGTYNFTINASSGDDSVSRAYTLVILEDETFDDLTFIYPEDAETEIRLNPRLRWTAVSTAQEYLVELSFINDFNTVLLAENVTSPSFNTPELMPETEYFWRVIPINDCLEGEPTVGSFTTETLTCVAVEFSTDTPIDIDESQAGTYQASIFIEEGHVDQISKLRVHVAIEHTYVGDLILKLVSPSGTEVVLIDQICDSSQDINVVFDDSAEVFTCNPDNPAIVGTLQPLNSLSALINDTVEGEWTLVIEDVMDEDGGVINSFGLEFCDGTAVLSVENIQQLPITMYPNPANSSFTVQFDSLISEASINIYDINGRLMVTDSHRFGNLRTIDISTLPMGLYIVEVVFGRSKTLKKLVKL